MAGGIETSSGAYLDRLLDIKHDQFDILSIPAVLQYVTSLKLKTPQSNINDSPIKRKQPDLQLLQSRSG